eukprot:scaffold133338_cov54-Phaeocystis_antarctica.AAC.2
MSVWLVSDMACQQSIHVQVRESIAGSAAWGSVSGGAGRSGGGGTAVHGGGAWLACLGKLCVALGGEAGATPSRRLSSKRQ